MMIISVNVSESYSHQGKSEIGRQKDKRSDAVIQDKKIMIQPFLSVQMF